MSTNKKTRRDNRGASAGEPSSYGKLYKSSAPSAPAAVTAPMVEAATASTGSDVVDWRGEYGYILGDLRKLAIVTVALVVGIVVIGFLM